jgi:peptide/nickel transport system substrate-binding protein
MSAFGTLAYRSIEQAWAPDPRTLTIAWKQPFIDADAVLGMPQGGLLPKHLLDDPYRSSKATFTDLPFWTAEFVGTGPYRVREWIPGIGVVLEANDAYVLGRPKIDEIDVKVIPDANTLSANLLAGAVDITPSVGSIDLGIQLRDQWRGGTVPFNYGADNWVAMFPQFVDPRPALLADLGVRRALTYAIDRQEMVNTVAAGMSPVPHSFLSPNQAAYREIEAAIPRYEYDPRQAAQLLEARGYRKGPDGYYRDETDRRIAMEIHSAPGEGVARPADVVADYWQRLGVEATVVRLSAQQALDFQFVATFPSFSVWGSPNDLNGLRFLHSSETRLPSNNFRASGSGNRSRYMNPEFDALLETHLKTVPMPERVQALGRVIRHIADEVTVIGLYYNPVPGAIAHRVVNVSQEWPLVYIAWNAQEWDLRT